MLRFPEGNGFSIYSLGEWVPNIRCFFFALFSAMTWVGSWYLCFDGSGSDRDVWG
jgi:hypothetical protein